MSYWNSETQEIVRGEPAPYGDDYPGWLSVDCGCCAGLEWGGFSPRECATCGGNGALAQHIATGMLALYPGGPLRGHASPKRTT